MKHGIGKTGAGQNSSPEPEKSPIVPAIQKMRVEKPGGYVNGLPRLETLKYQPANEEVSKNEPSGLFR